MKKRKPDHTKAIRSIIDEHFDQAEQRLDEVYAAHFADLKVIMDRHWRHRRDIVSDFLVLPRHAWNFISKKVLKKSAKLIPKNRKTQELETIIAEELLDIKGLEAKVEDYVKPYQLKFENEFTDVLEQIPALQRKKFTKQLEKHTQRLVAPVEGVRELALFLVAGMVGKVFSEKLTYGSLIAAGQAVATQIYIGQLWWFPSLWASVFGVPTWVTVIGAGAGIVSGFLVAPCLTPFFELGFNKLRAKKILREVLHSARHRLTDKKRDSLNVAGKVAIYLQVLPELVLVARKTARAFA